MAGNIRKVMNTLRDRQWLMVAAFLAFSSAAFVGWATTDAGTDTPRVWLVTMLAMGLVGAVTLIGIVVEAAMVFFGMLE
jgi:hypothetical protein